VIFRILALSIRPNVTEPLEILAAQNSYKRTPLDRAWIVQSEFWF
jgi:hypothetical protein